MCENETTKSKPTTEAANQVDVLVSCCALCGAEIQNSFIPVDSGIAHPVCYYIANPPKERKTFAEVLHNCDDQVLVRQLVERYMPGEFKERMIAEFNTEMTRKHKVRIDS